ncbi:MAG: hypothetical protein WC614_07510 [bacterium]
MKKLLFLGVVVLFWGCNHSTKNETTEYISPNWTSDGKIVFVKDYNFWKDESGPFVGHRTVSAKEELTICEINNDGSGFKAILEVAEASSDHSLGIGATSSVGEWIAFSRGDVNKTPYIYVLKRNGDSLKQLSTGRYPDFSPDANKIVYEKPNQGIWIMNKDGTNDHQIVSTGNSPAWSPDGGRIAYVKTSQETLFIADTNGTLINTYIPKNGGGFEVPDWGPIDSNTVICDVNGRDRSEIIYLSSSSIVMLGWLRTPKWSINGGYFIGYDENGYFIIKRDSTNKWYLKP